MSPGRYSYPAIILAPTEAIARGEDEAGDGHAGLGRQGGLEAGGLAVVGQGQAKAGQAHAPSGQGVLQPLAQHLAPGIM